jgi:hypothetical protein
MTAFAQFNPARPGHTVSALAIALVHGTASATWTVSTTS